MFVYTTFRAEIYNELPNVNQETWERSKSYKFGFESQDGSRQETADADGTVSGTYEILDANGDPLIVTVTALELESASSSTTWTKSTPGLFLIQPIQSNPSSH